jgi:hypothetical protein
MFYKNDNGQLLAAPNYVYSKDYTLLAEEKDTYTYPVDGWKWFDTEEQARLEYNIPAEEQE